MPAHCALDYSTYSSGGQKQGVWLVDVSLCMLMGKFCNHSSNLTIPGCIQSRVIPNLTGVFICRPEHGFEQ